jgi:hypothetical protein
MAQTLRPPNWQGLAAEPPKALGSRPKGGRPDNLAVECSPSRFVSYHLAQFIGTKRDRSDKKESDCGSALSAKSTLQPSIITTRVMATGSNWRAKEDEIRIGIAGARSLSSKAGKGREKGKRDRLESPAGQCPVRSNSAPGALPRKKMLRNFVAFFFSMATYYRNNISGAYLFSSV